LRGEAGEETAAAKAALTTADITVGIFADGIFAEGLFAEGMFAEGLFAVGECAGDGLVAGGDCVGGLPVGTFGEPEASVGVAAPNEVEYGADKDRGDIRGLELVIALVNGLSGGLYKTLGGGRIGERGTLGSDSGGGGGGGINSSGMARTSGVALFRVDTLNEGGV
jgi:hypothetical protein